MGDKQDTEGLARKAAQGNPEAFAQLVGRLRGRLELAMTARMGPLLRSRLTVDDAMQETLIQAHRSLDSFRDEGPGSFARWIYAVAENRLRDIHKFHTAKKRDAGREVPSPEETKLLQSIAASDTSPSTGARRRELAERLGEAIRRLPEPLAEIVVLRAIEQRDYEEIAERLDRPAATVRGLYARALKRLKHEFAA